RFERKDELLKLFPRFLHQKRNKTRRVGPLALDHPPVTIGADVSAPFQRNLILRHPPFGIGMNRHLNTWILFTQFLWGQHQPRPPPPMLSTHLQRKCSLVFGNFDLSKRPGGTYVLIICKDNARIVVTNVVQICDYNSGIRSGIRSNPLSVHLSSLSPPRRSLRSALRSAFLSSL